MQYCCSPVITLWGMFLLFSKYKDKHKYANSYTQMCSKRQGVAWIPLMQSWCSPVITLRGRVFTVQLRGQTSIEMSAHPKLDQRSISVFTGPAQEFLRLDPSGSLLFLFRYSCLFCKIFFSDIKLTVRVPFRCGLCIFWWVVGIFVHAIWCACVCLGL